MSVEHFDIVVIGAGAAGMMAAAHAADAPGDPRTLLVTDGPLGRSNTVMAQGGLQLPGDDPASRQRMLDDMVRSARVDIDTDRARRFIEEIPATIAQLEAWGLQLDRDHDGRLLRRTAGGLSEPRIVSAGDRLGPAIVAALRRGVEASGVEVRTSTRVTGLVPTPAGIEIGVVGDAGPATIGAKVAVVCTGGRTHHEAGARGEPSTNPPNSNHLMAASIADLGVEAAGDHFQYQPFGMVQVLGPYARCVPESVVGFAPRLLDRHGEDVGGIGEDRLDLTERMWRVAASGGAVETPSGPGLWLALDGASPRAVAAAFPKMVATLDRHGLRHDRILVYPRLHYQTGGFRTGPDGSTAIPGLRLAGEMVGGLHGRNRLMGNGITDSLVHGRVVGAAAGRAALS